MAEEQQIGRAVLANQSTMKEEGPVEILTRSAPEFFLITFATAAPPS
jgi:hypothetical protein